MPKEKSAGENGMMGKELLGLTDFFKIILVI